MRFLVIISLAIGLYSCLSNSTTKTKSVDTLRTEWGYIDSIGSMKLTLPRNSEFKQRKDTISYAFTKHGKVAVERIVNLKSFVPIYLLKDYESKVKDKRKLDFYYYYYFTDSVRVFYWDYDKGERKKILKEFCSFDKFQIIDYCYFNIGGVIYYDTCKIENADCATFNTVLVSKTYTEWPKTLGIDKNNLYSGSTVLTKEMAHDRGFGINDSLKHLLK